MNNQAVNAALARARRSRYNPRVGVNEKGLEMFRRLCLFILLALPLTAPFWAQNEADIYRDVSPSVVSIEVEISRFDTAGGAGFVIDENGHNREPMPMWSKTPSP